MTPTHLTASRQQEDQEEEADAEEGDLVRLPYLDTYLNLSVKVHHAVKWPAQQNATLRWVVKMDEVCTLGLESTRVDILALMPPCVATHCSKGEVNLTIATPVYGTFSSALVLLCPTCICIQDVYPLASSLNDTLEALLSSPADQRVYAGRSPSLYVVDRQSV
jgi:hypothetical protein